MKSSLGERYVPSVLHAKPIKRHVYCRLSALLGILLIQLKTSYAQIGSSICICAPAMYTMTFNFTQNCNDSFIPGDGVLTTDCAITPFQNPNVTDLIPVSVSSIDIIELDAELAFLTQSSRFGDYGDGESIMYTAVSNEPSMINATVYPKALQLSVIGNNAEGETLFFAGLLLFSTECTLFPVVEKGSTIGWIKFVSRQLLTALCVS